MLRSLFSDSYAKRAIVHTLPGIISRSNIQLNAIIWTFSYLNGVEEADACRVYGVDLSADF